MIRRIYHIKWWLDLRRRSHENVVQALLPLRCSRPVNKKVKSSRVWYDWGMNYLSNVDWPVVGVDFFLESRELWLSDAGCDWLIKYDSLWLMDYDSLVSPMFICFSTSDCKTLSFSASASIAFTLSFIASNSYMIFMWNSQIQTKECFVV